MPSRRNSLASLALWLVRCHAGRRCADLYLVDDVDVLPAGAQVEIAWTCCDCGTRYSRVVSVPSGVGLPAGTSLMVSRRHRAPRAAAASPPIAESAQAVATENVVPLPQTRRHDADVVLSANGHADSLPPDADREKGR